MLMHRLMGMRTWASCWSSDRRTMEYSIHISFFDNCFWIFLAPELLSWLLLLFIWHGHTPLLSGIDYLYCLLFVFKLIRCVSWLRIFVCHRKKTRTKHRPASQCDCLFGPGNVTLVLASLFLVCLFLEGHLRGTWISGARVLHPR